MAITGQFGMTTHDERSTRHERSSGINRMDRTPIEARTLRWWHGHRAEAALMSSTVLFPTLALASGYSFAPRESVIVLFAAFPIVGGILAGVLAGVLGWRLWTGLLAGLGLIAAIALLWFTQKGWSFFAPVAAPAVIVIFLLCQAAAHALWRVWQRRRVPENPGDP